MYLLNMFCYYFIVNRSTSSQWVRTMITIRMSAFSFEGFPKTTSYCLWQHVYVMFIVCNAHTVLSITAAFPVVLRCVFVVSCVSLSVYENTFTFLPLLCLRSCLLLYKQTALVLCYGGCFASFASFTHFSLDETGGSIHKFSRTKPRTLRAACSFR